MYVLAELVTQYSEHQIRAFEHSSVHPVSGFDLAGLTHFQTSLLEFSDEFGIAQLSHMALNTDEPAIPSLGTSILGLSAFLLHRAEPAEASFVLAEKGNVPN